MNLHVNFNDKCLFYIRGQRTILICIMRNIHFLVHALGSRFRMHLFLSGQRTNRTKGAFLHIRKSVEYPLYIYWGRMHLFGLSFRSVNSTSLGEIFWKRQHFWTHCMDGQLKASALSKGNCQRKLTSQICLNFFGIIVKSDAAWLACAMWRHFC